MPTTHGSAQLQTPDPKVHVPAARKFGLGAMLAAGFVISGAGALVTGGLLTVVVVTGRLTVVVDAMVVVVVGATVVGVTTVVGVGVVVVGLDEPFVVGRELLVEEAMTCEWRTATALRLRCVTWRTIVVVVDSRVVVVAGAVLVAPELRLALGVTMFAIAGSAVVARTIPRTSDPIEPMSTERRGRRRGVVERPLGSLESFCPCVILVMDQLSKMNSKAAPTNPQQLLNSV